MTISSIQPSFSSLAAILEDHPKHYLILKKNPESNDQYNWELRPLAEKVTGYFFSSFSEEEKMSVQNLKSLIGASRLRRIFSHPDLSLKDSLKKLDSNSLLLENQLLREVFLGLGSITKEDIDEKTSKPFDQLSHREINSIFKALIPFDNLFDLFCKRKVQIPFYDTNPSDETPIQILEKRVWIVFQAYQTYYDSKLSSLELSIRDIEILTARLGDREPPLGSVIPLKEGFYYYRNRFTSYESRIDLLAALDAHSPPKVVCTATAFRPSSSTPYFTYPEDMLDAMGSEGVMKIWPHLRKTLMEMRPYHVEVIGKSRGGTQAQYLAALINSATPLITSSLATYNSPGIPPDLESRLWHDIRNNPRKPPIRIFVFRNSSFDPYEEDYIPYFGGMHLGFSERTSSKDIECYRLFPGQVSRAPFVKFSKIDFFSAIQCSLSKTHVRQTTLNTFSLIRCRDPGFLSLGNTYEPYRFSMLNHLYLLPFRWASSWLQTPFDEYYDSEKEEFRKNLGPV